MKGDTTVTKMTDLSGYAGGPDAITKHLTSDQMQRMLEDRAAELHPDLVDWVEEGTWGPMLRHPLVYAVPLFSNGLANKAYEAKRKALAEAVEAQEWASVLWIHERPHRLNALIEYVTGRDGDTNEVLPATDHFDLVLSAWIDSENIQQNEDKWRALFGNLIEPNLTNPWLGSAEDRAVFDALPDPIPAWRGGVVGDWSWTTDPAIADFFSRRSGFQKRHALIPKADCFGYTNQRGESELFVRLTDERYALVYPDRVEQ